MWPYPWTHVGTPSHLGHMDRVAATMPSQAHAGAAQEAPDTGQWEGQDVPLVRPSSCNVKGGIPSSRRYLPTYLHEHPRAWHPDLPITSMAPEKSLDPLRPEPTYGALDRTAELLAKPLSGSEDPDVTALSKAVKAKLGITEPLPKPAPLSPLPRLSTLADDLKKSRASRLLPKVTCPSPFHPRTRTVSLAELQDVPVPESEKRRLSALAPLAGVSTPPSGLTPEGGKMCRPIAQVNIQLELPEIDPKNLPEWVEEFADFLLLTGQSRVDVATKCSLLKRSCKKKILQKQVTQIAKTCSTSAEVLERLEKAFPVYETDLSVRTQIEELPMLPELPSAARVSEYMCDLEYLFSRMNVGSSGATEPHLWLMSKIPQRTWDDCRAALPLRGRAGPTRTTNWWTC